MIFDMRAATTDRSHLVALRGTVAAAVLWSLGVTWVVAPVMSASWKISDSKNELSEALAQAPALDLLEPNEIDEDASDESKLWLRLPALFPGWRRSTTSAHHARALDAPASTFRVAPKRDPAL